MMAQPGWRHQEMEVRVYLHNEHESAHLYGLRLNGEIYPTGYALMYVVPEELEKIRSAGLEAEVMKEDLNEYYRDFWKDRDAYHTYDEIIQVMNTLSFSHSSICRKHDFGSSLEGRQLTALKISDNVADDEDEPEVMFDGGIHGDEIGGPENLIRFAQYLCDSYGTDPDITSLINEREIWLYIMVNPDGRVNMIRYNNNGVDLNRDWGYMWNAEGSSPAPFSQVETKALRNCLYDHQFVVHTTYHSGTEYLSYPWSYRPNPTPDNNHINHLASLYASTSGYSNLPYGQGYTGMYAINGSSKDSYYGIMGSIGWTMEISMDKQPPTTQIQYYYELNLPAMVSTIEHCGYGIRGSVTDAQTGEPLPAIIWINDFYPTYADPEVGDFHKYLTAGTYSVTVSANGYLPQTSSNVTVTSSNVTTVNFALQSGGGQYAWRMPYCIIPDNNFDDEGYTPAALGAPDNVHYSLGRDGWAVLDMHQTVMDGPGNEIKIYENDSDDEGYACYASMNMDGPWIFLGNGTGTTAFNFTTAGLIEARYIKIVDDGNGSASGDNAGFDLDALEALEQPLVVYLLLDCFINDPNGNNNHRIDPGESFDLVLTLRNHGGLVAENTTANLNYDSTWVTVPDPDIDFGTLAHGDVVEIAIPMTAGESAPLESVIMMVLNVSANEGGFTQSFPINYTVGALVEDWESNSFSQFPWSTYGTLPWTITFIGPYEGTYSAKSGNIHDNQNSKLEIELDVIGYDDLSFYRKVSSEAGFDFLRFYIDDILQDEWSGVMDWELESYNIEPGNHVFRWEFVKDDGVSLNFDCGWIDFITLPSCILDGSLHALANAFPHEYCHPGASQLGAFIVGGTPPYHFSWTPEDSLSSPNAQFPTANPSETTVYSVWVNDNAFNTASSAITITIHPVPDTPVILQEGDSLISSALEGNQWYNSTGMIEGETGMVYYPQEEDDFYTIVTSPAGCISEPSNVVHFLFTGIPEQKNALWRIYPVPAKEYLYIVPPAGFKGDVEVEVNDILGNRLYSTVNSVSGFDPVKLHTASLPAGIYLVSLTSLDSGKRVVEKFVK
jgi:hypothetical protein